MNAIIQVRTLPKGGGALRPVEDFTVTAFHINYKSKCVVFTRFNEHLSDTIRGDITVSYDKCVPIITIIQLEHSGEEEVF